MRDLLPEDAQTRRTLARTILERFSLHGYSLVTPPAFEFADVLERGLGTLDPSDVLRFVEPDSGRVAALRPDVTPQIARMVATRLRDRPGPYRLCYEGSVLRRRSHRARKHRQIFQVGVELAGEVGPGGDLEIMAVATAALRAAGLQSFALDLGDAGILRALLAGAPASFVSAVSAALERKDDAELQELGQKAQAGQASQGGLAATVALLRELLRLQGGREVLREGQKLLARTAAAPSLARLVALYEALSARDWAPRLSVDLSEVRGFAYYTGPVFQVYAPGPGEAVGAGGRYDELLGRFGVPMPAVGFALDLDRLEWALRTAGNAVSPDARVLVVGPQAEARAESLRALGISAMTHRPGREGPTSDEDLRGALAHAKAWGQGFLWSERGLFEVSSGMTGVAGAEGRPGATPDVALDAAAVAHRVDPRRSPGHAPTETNVEAVVKGPSGASDADSSTEKRGV